MTPYLPGLAVGLLKATVKSGADIRVRP